MKEKKIRQISVPDDQFRKIKHNHQSVYVCLRNETNSTIKLKEKIIFTNKKNKKIKKKVIKINEYASLNELLINTKKKKLGYNRKDTIEFDNLKENEIKQYGLLAIELHMKKHIFRKLILIISAIISLIVGVFLLNHHLNVIRIKNLSDKIIEINQEKSSFVFVDINPSLVLSIKKGEVTNVACLNFDCLKIYNEINIIGKALDTAVDSLIKVVEENGMDVSKGVTLKSTDEIQVSDKVFIQKEKLTEKEQEDLLAQIKNNNEIKNANDNYYLLLYETLKKDRDFDKVFTCDMDDKTLRCRFVLDAFAHDVNSDDDYNIIDKSKYNKLMQMFGLLSDKVVTTFKKFGYDYSGNDIYIEGVKFSYVPLFTLNDVPYKNVLRGNLIASFPDDVCKLGIIPYQNSVNCQIVDGYYLIGLENFDLINPAESFKTAVAYEMGMKDAVLAKYEAFKLLYENENKNNLKNEEDIKQEQIAEAKRQAEIEKIIKHRNDLIDQGYGLNREETNKLCSSDDEFCEYLCLYGSDDEVAPGEDLVTINCELIRY